MRSRPTRVAATSLLVSLAVAADARAQAPADTTRKSPTLAGVASYVLPGVGSWYAGNGDHAAVHGAIALGIGVAGAVASSGSGCRELSCTGRNSVPFGLLVLAYLTNEVWSTVTAVHDAQASNARAERLRTGRIDVAPALHLAAPSGGATQPRIELRLLRVEY
jgi:hypothetical protein